MSRLVLLVLWFLCQFAHVVSSLWMLVAIIVGSPRAKGIALAYDRVGNVATGGGWNETISRRAARGTREGNRKWCLLCRLLDFVDKDHCKHADVLLKPPSGGFLLCSNPLYVFLCDNVSRNVPYIHCWSLNDPNSVSLPHTYWHSAC